MFNQTFLIDAATRFSACPPGEDRWRCATELLHTLGSAWLSAGTAGSSSQAGLVVRSSTPDSLMRDYIGERVYLDDPWMTHCAASTDIASVALSARPTHGPDGLHARQARLFMDHGIHRAVLVPCYSGPRPGGIVLYARDAEVAQRMITPEGQATIRLATALVAAYYRPDEDLSKSGEVYRLKAKLTTREREALQWLSQGLLSAAIAERMRVTPVTVAKHLHSARRKLGARTREQALAIAVRDGLIAI